jgi:hypothetical protein
MSAIDCRVEESRRFLSEAKLRATYGAVAAYAGGSARSIGRRLGARRAQAAWIVNSKSGLPTGYSKNELHRDLTKHAAIIRSGAVLKRLLKTRYVS